MGRFTLLQRLGSPDDGVSFRALRERCCETIFRETRSAAMTTILGACVLTGAMSGVVRQEVLLAWFALMVLVSGIRLELGRRWARIARPSELQLLRFQEGYRLAINVCAALWGSTTVFLQTGTDSPHQTILTVILTGVTSVAVTTLAVDRRLVHTFLLLTIVPLSFHYAVQFNTLDDLLASLILLYLVFMFGNSNRVARHLHDNLRLEIEAQNRERVLRQSEERLTQAQAVAHLGSFEWDIETDAMRWSDEHYRLWGLEPGVEAPGRALLIRAIPAEDRAHVQRCIADALRARAEYECDHRVVWPDGSVHHVQARGKLVIDAAGKIVRMVGTVQDISQRHAAEDRIRHLAFYDPLTGLPNRHLLLERLQASLAHCETEGCSGALCFIDLDNFKNLNDTHGHDQGDELLRLVAKRVQAVVRPSDTVARLGGDEFVVMLGDLAEAPGEARSAALAIAEDIRNALQAPYELHGREYHSSSSIGIALFQRQDSSVDELLKWADLAMYQAKASGRNAVCLFSPELQAKATVRAALEEDLRSALQLGQFELHYQPQVDADGRWTGAEVLLRWQHPTRGAVSPADMIPIAEESGLILPIGNWVLHTACQQLVHWARNPATIELSLAVNVSARQFHQGGFVDEVQRILDSTGADPRRLKLELTESMLAYDIDEVTRKMTALRQIGIGFSLDDFGTGYSSLAYLKNLPLEQLKIDQTFVRDVLTDPNDAAIARMILDLGKSLGLYVIAEGVETEGQRSFLAEHGCVGYQGYLFSRPVPVGEFERLLAGQPTRGSAVSSATAARHAPLSGQPEGGYAMASRSALQAPELRNAVNS